jgi:Carbamoyl-phosphate synthase L chain, ATP binding domain
VHCRSPQHATGKTTIRAGLANTPQSSALRAQALGDKTKARALAIDVGVPIVPGTNEPLADVAAAKAFADEAGYPVMLKAAMGGGGRGMRVAHACAPPRPCSALTPFTWNGCAHCVECLPPTCVTTPVPRSVAGFGAVFQRVWVTTPIVCGAPVSCHLSAQASGRMWFDSTANA